MERLPESDHYSRTPEFETATSTHAEKVLEVFDGKTRVNILSV